MIFLNQSLTLDNESIVTARDECATQYKGIAGKRYDPGAQADLAVEELLVSLQKQFGTETVCHITGEKKQGAIIFEFKVKSEQRDPFESPGDFERYSYRIMQRYCKNPAFTYITDQKLNVITFEIPMKQRKNKTLIDIAIAVVLALISFAVMKLIPQDITTVINTELITPVFTKLTNIICAIATPLVFFAVINGITGVGSAVTLEKMGKKLLKNMIIAYVVAAVAFSSFAILFYHVGTQAGAAGQGVLGQLVQLVLDIIPDNLLACFTVDNDLQVIVIAIFVGIVLLMFGKRAEKIVSAVELMSDIVNKMMTIVCKCLPVIVYLGVLKISFTDVSQLAQLYKLFIVFILSAFTIVLITIIRTMATVRVSPAKLFKKQLATLMINLTTSSQVAAVPENIKCCKNKMGIDERFIDFGIPLGIVVYMPVGAAFLGLTAWALADLSGTMIDFTVVIKIAVVAVIIAIAAPPIPGSALAVMPILFSACGIPNDCYPVGIIIGTVLGYVLPAFNGYLMQLELLITGTQLDIVDRDILLSEE